MGQMGGGGGQHHHFQYQALLAAVQTMNGQGQGQPGSRQPHPQPQQHQPVHFPLSLPFPAAAHAPAHGAPGAGAGASAAAVAHNHGHGHVHNANGNANASPPTPRGFADWSASTSAFTSLAAQTTPSPATTNTNAFHYSVSPCYAFWTHFMLNKNAYCNYPNPPPHPPPHPQPQDHPNRLCHNDSCPKDPGPASSFGVEPFTTPSLVPNTCAHMPSMEGPVSAKEAETSEDLPRVVRSSVERETRNNGQPKSETVDSHLESKQGRESCATKFNSGEYQVILRKELTKSDVGNVGRIVLPKKDAEASLPPLFQRDPVILQMDDMVLPVTWKFKYRFWPNNKSRMYILDATGEFVKTHGLQAGDVLIIYKNSVPGKFIVRGEKAIQQTANP